MSQVSGIWIPPPISLWLPVDWPIRFPPIGANRKRARMWRNIEKHVPRVMTLSPPITISLVTPGIGLIFVHYLFSFTLTTYLPHSVLTVFYLLTIVFCWEKFSLLVIALLNLIMTWNQYLIGLNGGWWLWMNLRLNQLFLRQRGISHSIPTIPS